MNKVHVTLFDNLLAIVAVKTSQAIVSHFFETFRASYVGNLIQRGYELSDVTLKAIDSLRSSYLLGSHRLPSRD